MTKNLVVNTFFFFSLIVLHVRSPKWVSLGKMKMLVGLPSLAHGHLPSPKQEMASWAFLTWHHSASESRVPLSLTRQHWAHLVMTLGPPESSRILSPSQGQLISNLIPSATLIPLAMWHHLFTCSGDRDIFGVHYSVHHKKVCYFPLTLQTWSFQTSTCLKDHFSVLVLYGKNL